MASKRQQCGRARPPWLCCRAKELALLPARGRPAHGGDPREPARHGESRGRRAGDLLPRRARADRSRAGLVEAASARMEGALRARGRALAPGGDHADRAGVARSPDPADVGLMRRLPRSPGGSGNQSPCSFHSITRRSPGETGGSLRFEITVPVRSKASRSSSHPIGSSARRNEPSCRTAVAQAIVAEGTRQSAALSAASSRAATEKRTPNGAGPSP